MKKLILLGVIGLASVAFSAQAQFFGLSIGGHCGGFSIGIGGPVCSVAAPAVYPAPVVGYAPPVAYAPAPVYYPSVAYAAPYYYGYAPVYRGWYGGCYRGYCGRGCYGYRGGYWHR
ncbi:MAG TPA: hypothetical protein VMU04_13315 [Candidatus Acidoferrum sp.]|nr:hypothetical protein [Candidatus Acidoferrum sp.]